MLTNLAKLAFFVFVLLLLISCQQPETVEVVRVVSEVDVRPVAILIVDDFGPPEYHLSIGDLVASDAFALQNQLDLSDSLQLPSDFGTQVDALEPPALDSNIVLANPDLETGAGDGPAVALDNVEIVLDAAPYQLLRPFPKFDSACLSTPDGQGYYASVGMGYYASVGMTGELPEMLANTPHGEMVYDQLIEALDDGGAKRAASPLSGYRVFEDKPWLRDLELWSVDDDLLLLAQIDTYGFSTDHIANRIDDTMLILQERMDEINAHWDTGAIDLGPIKGSVLNMSFALIPCDLSLGRSLTQNALFSAYKDALLAALNETPDMSELGQALSYLQEVEKREDEDLPPEEAHKIQNDLFYAPESMPVLTQPGFRKAVIDLAYFDPQDLASFAGHLSECDNLDDAKLAEIDPLCEVLEREYGIPVIPVAAAGNYKLGYPFYPAAWKSTISIGAPDLPDLEYSNKSEVIVDGSVSLTVDGETKTIGGTSFSAPRFSVLAALYLLQGGDATCTDGDFQTTPPLGDGDIQRGNWAHLPIEDAAAIKCDEFPTSFDTAVMAETEVVVVEVTRVIEVVVREPIVLNRHLGDDPLTADPQLAVDDTSSEIAHNTFISLTRLDPFSGEALPWLAMGWEQDWDANGDPTWTFYLRDDVAWVRWDDASETVVQEADSQGRPRFVRPSDVEYGIKRLLDPETSSDYAYLLYDMINAQAVNQGDSGYTLADLGVRCDDEALTCTFTLYEPAPWWPSILQAVSAAPVPSWAIDDYGDGWIEPGRAVSSGPYVMAGWDHGKSIWLVKNPFWFDVANVQIDQVNYEIAENLGESANMYDSDELDTAAPHPEDIEIYQADPVISQELEVVPRACTYYYGFNNQKYPFTDPRIRVAFSQAIDRERLIHNVLQGGQTPASTLAPVGIFGAPYPGDVGIRYDPAAALDNLHWFLEEEGLTIEDFNDLDIVLMYNTGEGHTRIAEAIRDMWAEVLRIDVRLEQQEWRDFLVTTRKNTPIEDMSHIFRMSWCADYADEHNWLYEIFNATGGSNRVRRNCTDPNCGNAFETEFDHLTQEARYETDPAVRADLYAQAEQLLTVEEAAYAPLYHYGHLELTKPWLIRTYPSFAPPAIYEWSIDWQAKQSALGR